MAFTLPQFNCLFHSWRLDGATLVWSRIITNGPCQWYVYSRTQDWADPLGGGEEIMLHHLRVPKGTDIDEGDLVEVEPGSFWFYQLVETDRVHLNFPNEYFVGFANNLDEENTPFFVDDENGVELLTETGFRIYTEVY
jgi:hypothetical protein